jgi:hypothetical protein
MRDLSQETRRLIEQMFPGEAARVAETLERVCNDDLPLVGKPTPTNTNVERVRYAVLKLSGGTAEGFGKSIELAERDWRDVLVFAGFGNSLTEHRRWAAEILSESEG